MRITEDIAFMTPEEMAAKLRISIRKLQQMMKLGTAPKHVKLGGKVLFPVEKEVRHD
jgi:predicted DNA-binding transcriptional regulator AlpA